MPLAPDLSSLLSYLLCYSSDEREGVTEGQTLIEWDRWKVRVFPWLCVTKNRKIGFSGSVKSLQSLVLKKRHLILSCMCLCKRKVEAQCSIHGK